MNKSNSSQTPNGSWYQQHLQHLAAAAGCLIVTAACGIGFFLSSKDSSNTNISESPIKAPVKIEINIPDADTSPQDSPAPGTEPVIIVDSPAGKLLTEARLLASGYDYDAAIALLQSDSKLASDPSVQEAIAAYEAEKSTLVKAKLSEVTHVFFHSLIMDNKKAFDGENDSAGYNQVMTTAGGI